LQEVDDFHLSQACINPLFTSAASASAPPARNSHPPERNDLLNTTSASETAPVILPKRRRARSQAPKESSSSSSSLVPSNVQPADSNPVTATLADCLACSGCITTAETVLIQEQHNLEKLKRVLLDGNRSFLVVVTLSAASIADLCRHLGFADKEHFLPQLTLLLHQYLKISAVLDGILPLQYSLVAAAQEFCSAYRGGQHSQVSSNDDPMDLDNDERIDSIDTATKEASYEQQLLPSMALSSTETKYWLPPDGRVQVLTSNKTTMRSHQSLPILSSSCPAIACWIEKSQHALVPHLSTVVSPMVAAAQLFWNSASLYHLAVMPCHDKKLEASRLDFLDYSQDGGDDANEKKKIRRVDMVITTFELLQLLQGAIAVSSPGWSPQPSPLPRNEFDAAQDDIVRSALAAVPTSGDVTVRRIGARDTPAQQLYEEMQSCLRGWNQRLPVPLQPGPYLFTTLSSADVSEAGDVEVVNASNQSTTISAAESRFSALGSGGYADFIFRFAARELFHLDCFGHGTEIWRPVTDPTKNTPRISARVARHRKQREYYEAIIYQDISTGQYSLGDTKNGDAMDDMKYMEDKTVVLRFVIAYGMSTVQHVLNNLRTEDGSFTHEKRFDYMECMACSSNACINGNGQIRSVERETPGDVRNRVQQTLLCFDTSSIRLHTRHSGLSMLLDQEEKDIKVSMAVLADARPLNPSLFTRYHVVPPMQHTLGAAAGVAVNDTMW
jgi:iron only hydrogenase large subunit-like protein